MGFHIWFSISVAILAQGCWAPDPRHQEIARPPALFCDAELFWTPFVLIHCSPWRGRGTWRTRCCLREQQPWWKMLAHVYEPAHPFGCFGCGPLLRPCDPAQTNRSARESFCSAAFERRQFWSCQSLVWWRREKRAWHHHNGVLGVAIGWFRSSPGKFVLLLTDRRVQCSWRRWWRGWSGLRRPWQRRSVARSPSRIPYAVLLLISTCKCSLSAVDLRPFHVSPGYRTSRIVSRLRRRPSKHCRSRNMMFIHVTSMLGTLPCGIASKWEE